MKPGPWSVRQPSRIEPAIVVFAMLAAILAFAATWVVLGWLPSASSVGELPRVESVAPPLSIQVIDGDTVRVRGQVYRLVGFDTPELDGACSAERAMASRASARLRELIVQGAVDFERVACSCRAGTEGTRACNYGRLCGRLTANGRDVGAILIGEGLARSYVCGATTCPRRASWC